MNKLTEWLTKPFIEDLNEDVNLPINVGDTVKMGKFKNKKVVVKKIDWNEKGDLLINGRPALKFRMTKDSNLDFNNKSEQLKEGVNDPGIFKAVFLAGGPGSGKTFAARNLFGMPDSVNISMSGMKMVNSDKELKHLLNKYGFGTDLDKMPDELFNQLTNPKDKDYSGLRDYSKSLTKQRMKQYREGRLGMIVDGTGHKWKNIKKEKQELEKLGYDTYMIFVNTSLEVAQQRNQKRDRILPPKLLEKSWRDVQNNRGAFKSLFKNNFIEIQNNETLNDTQIEKKFRSLARKYTNVFMKRPITNKIAKSWIKKQQILKKSSIKEFVNKPKMKKALQHLVDKNLVPKEYVKNIKKLQTFLTNNPMVMTQLLRLLGEKVNEAFAVRGSKVEKFITGKNLTHKGKKYKEIEFETLGIDNNTKMVKLRILAPKKLFGQEVPVRFQTLRRGPFLKTDTGKKLKEQKEIKKVVGIYGGRFQPFGPHHKKTYEWLKTQFDDVYIVTSNLKSLPRHPMNFKEKVRHMTKMGIPKNRISQEKNLYGVKDALKGYDEDTTAVIYVVGKKDAGRLKSGTYFDDYKKNKNSMVGFKERGYILTAPHVSMKVAGMEVSGTSMRQLLGSPEYADDRERRFKKFFGYYDKGVFNMMTNKFKKLFESIDDFLINNPNTIPNLLNEASTTTAFGIDDGPPTFYNSFTDYKGIVNKWVEELYSDMGWEVVSYMIGDKAIDPGFDYTSKTDTVPAVAYGKRGTGAYGERFGEMNPIKAYKNHISYVIDGLGFEVLEWLGFTKDGKDTTGVDVEVPIGFGVDAKSQNTERKKNLALTSKEDTQGDTLTAIDAKLDKRKKGVKQTIVIPHKKPRKNVKEVLNLEKEIDLLVEGGAYGHMAHPFDDNNLTFGDLRNIIIDGLGGTLDREDNVTEKLDGQNLMVSWVDGELRAARNKGHLKNHGKAAPTIKGVKSIFSGRGNIAKAFIGAMTDLEKAVGRLSDPQKEKVFGNGSKWMNLEIIFPQTANIIDYDISEIVFHGTVEYNKSGRPIGQPRDSARMLAGMIKQTNNHIQKMFKIGKPNFLTVPKSQDFSKKKAKYLSKLNKLQKHYALRSTDTLGEYHRAYWEEYIFNASKQFNFNLKNNHLVGLVNRWAFFDKTYKIAQLKKDFKSDPKWLDWVLSTDKENHTKISKENIKPFEVLFFEVGSEILKNISGFLAVSPDKAVLKIRKDVIKSMKELQSKRNIDKLKNLKIQIEKLKEIGGLDAVVPSEGIVFKYKGNVYKFTGAFAPINQIIGSLKFG